MASVDDIIQLKFYQQAAAGMVLNVFYYRVSVAAAGNAANALLDQFDEDIVPVYANTQSNVVSYISLEALNGMDNSEYASSQALAAASGTRSGTSMPMLNVAKIRFNKAQPGTRYGYKAISGILDSDVGSDDTLGALVLGLLNTLGGALVTPLVNAGFTFVPCQVTGGFKLGVAPTFSHDYDDLFVMPYVTTQVTRKRGRGA